MTLVLKDEYLPAPPIAAIPRRFLVLGVVCVLFLGTVAATGLEFYRWRAHHGVARTIARVLPLPAGHVEGRVIWYRALSERANALEVLAAVPAGESIDLAMFRAQREAIVVRVADELGVAVSDDEVAAFVAEDKELRLLIDRAGWTERDYRAAVTSYLLSEKAEIALLTSTPHQAYARGRLESLADKLDKGVPFEDLALNYSEGNAAYAGGDLGYVNPNILPPALDDAARTTDVGAVSGIVETERAFWLVKVIDRLAEDSEGIAMARVRVIEIKKDLLGEIVTRALGTANVVNWLY